MPAPRTPPLAEVEKELSHTGNIASIASATFTIIDPGFGPLPIPSWIRDANIRWSFGFGNRPELELCFTQRPLEGVVYRRVALPGGQVAWMGHNPSRDCFSTHWHNGAISLQTFEEHVGWDTPDGKWAKDAKAIKRSYQMLATTQQKGYADRAFDIALEEQELPIDGKPTLVPAGTILRLRGPWHGGTGRNDTVQVVGLVYDEKAQAQARRLGRWRRPWWRQTKIFGYHILLEHYINILATFYPHCPIARIEDKGRSWFEPCLPQTGRPRLMTEKQRR